MSCATTKGESMNISDSVYNLLDLLRSAEGFENIEDFVNSLIANRGKPRQQDKSKQDAKTPDISSFFLEELSDKDLNLLYEICENEQISYKDFTVKSVLTTLKKYRTQSINIPDFDSKTLHELDEILRSGEGKTYKGLAETRIKKVIEQLMDYNDSQIVKTKKWYISTSLIFALTGSNRTALNDFFEKHSDTIDAHNAKHKLKALDNRKGIGAMSNDALKKVLWAENALQMHRA
jgi:hypothetical protein